MVGTATADSGVFYQKAEISSRKGGPQKGCVVSQSTALQQEDSWDVYKAGSVWDEHLP